MDQPEARLLWWLSGGGGYYVAESEVFRRDLRDVLNRMKRAERELDRIVAERVYEDNRKTRSAAAVALSQLAAIVERHRDG